MGHLQARSRSKAPITPEASFDEYRMRFVISHSNLLKLRPEQSRDMYLAAAEQMEAWAGQMRDLAAQVLEVC